MCMQLCMQMFLCMYQSYSQKKPVKNFSSLIDPYTSLHRACRILYIFDHLGDGIDDSIPVSQSRHTLRFQPMACHSILRQPRADPRPGMVLQAYQPDTAHGELAVFEMAEKKPGKRHFCCGQCRSDERHPDRCAGVMFLPFPKPKTRMEDGKAWIKACGRPHDQLNPSMITKNYYVCSNSKVCITSSALVHGV